MNFSYWERKTWFSNVDFTIIGSGIVGLNCALSLRNRFPKTKILVLEKGILPNGASTKNAGFACFGSISEILDDLKTHSEETVLQLIEKRKTGLELLRKNLSDENIGYKNLGGYELFVKKDETLYEECFQKKKRINKLLQPFFNEEVFTEVPNQFGFQQLLPKLIFNKFEGQIDTGKMMSALLKKAYSEGIFILNQVAVEGFSEVGGNVEIFCDQFSFKTKKLFITTNGFSKELGIENVKPARAQVLITKPIENLHIKGTFHLEKGYYYFRNIDDRILFGGGRNLDFKGEETTKMEETEPIQRELKRILRESILPETEHEIDFAWSGIMGVGKQKEPIVKQLSENVFCGVRLGGMGIAIGSFVGKELADLIE
ncbi:MAG TPA: FAD-binding oxidoreductase [Flavobacteriaceae bacterium]|nr:FAD-binding oxidoreductase [Flavobacteriaceae bacterium]